MGLYQKDKSVEPGGNWVWSNGEPLIFTNWYPGEPNNGSNEDYGEFNFRAGTWNDASNNAIFYGIIELNDPSYAYNFKFTYGDGDFYQGMVYAAWDKGYSNGYTQTVTDENGLAGKYEITTVAFGVPSSSINGRVYVTNYYDAQSNRFYDVVNGKATGLDHLGSESGYIIKDSVPEYRFGNAGGKILRGGCRRQVFLQIHLWQRRLLRGDCLCRPGIPGLLSGINDSLQGRDGGDGYYQITGVSYEGDSSKYGQVYVNLYFDKETNNKYKPLGYGKAVGTGYLGSESDYIVKVDNLTKFGQGYLEADVACDKYNFVYYYGNGDSYSGYVYADPAYGYYYGKKWTTTNATGNTGYYLITAANYTGVNTTEYNKVYVNSYYDGDMSKKSFVPLNNKNPLGTNYLGSEIGYIVKDAIPTYHFGQGSLEADVGDKYTFQYTYGNGDYYVGTVYADPAYGYYTGWKKSVTNETGNTGYYEILGQEYTRTSGTNKGKVFVSKYYDGDSSKKIFSPTNTSALTDQYLGNEFGFIYQFGVMDYKFRRRYR